MWIPHLNSYSWKNVSIVCKKQSRGHFNHLFKEEAISIFFKKENFWGQQMFAIKSWKWNQLLCGLQPFGRRIKKCTQPWAAWSRCLLPLTGALSFTRWFDSSHTLREGEATSASWVSQCVCVSVYVWGPVGKYLFVLFFVWLLPPFIAYKSTALVCLFGWLCFVFVCLICLAHRSEKVFLGGMLSVLRAA